MDYNSYISTVANISAQDQTTPEFLQIIPQMISYAEDRIYRELDMLDTVNVNTTSNLTPQNRNFTLPSAPSGVFLTITGLNIFYGTGPQRQQLQPVAKSFLDSVYGSPTGATLPQYFAMVTQDTIVLGPYPDIAYQVEVIGTFQPAPLTSTNPTTILTELVPDLFLAASMVFFSGYQRDFGSQADNPAQAQSWENQYQILFKSAMLLELRKKFAGPGWTSLSSVPVTPTR
jgi:hypothetical protein